MNLSDTIVANSEQLNADDLMGGPVTVTITGVEKGTADQPVFVHLAQFPGRTYRPAKSMRRVLVAAWGTESSAYVGRQLTLFNDPTVRWAGQEVGGIRISHLSHLTGPLTVALTVTRGKRAPFTVQPIPTRDESGRDWLKELAAAQGDPKAIAALGVAARDAFAAAPIIATIRAEYQRTQGEKK